ncbi:hypothetical protein CJ030_MR7G025995 [Morella rubra]|uniref:Uncharacterized protein n=1 Tax=Morella rubra TaxID=262757 RepID=A0A6A1UYP8_9ROSI|nr:hypothetical protein CJ030_MR7G025995 [Morella rubra]
MTSSDLGGHWKTKGKTTPVYDTGVRNRWPPVATSAPDGNRVAVGGLGVQRPARSWQDVGCWSGQRPTGRRPAVPSQRHKQRPGFKVTQRQHEEVAIFKEWSEVQELQ